MGNSVVASYVATDIIFLGTGIMLVSAAVVWQKELMNEPTLESVARFLLLKKAPLSAVIANGVMVLVAFFLSLPTFALPTSRTWLKAHGWLVMVCALFTLVLGLMEWISTLTTRANLETIWGQQTSKIQSMLQQKFSCCGYLNSTSPLYVVDSVCTSDIVAASKEGCVGPFANYAERWINLLFTALFGIVAMDAVLILCAAMLIRYRKEQLRYRLIDQKWGVGNI
ncbi:hypothetical protein L873DRAFT_1675095 [Choiromyces venosus 120613-1]|uniref:Tetraspanin n=1 Tax=Choiromyces venosus 120613-1 TaxID=1336337 RepID=A0A3N4K782_9PEZI|nr:hypothetical protein L873DRAFT_1675095 [Choiromyces venosus 120613-1]